jgi:acyl dehydratase
MAIDHQKLLDLEIPQREYTYTERDSMLYALGTGFGGDPMDTEELRFVYEQDMKASPTQATVVAWDRTWVPRTGIDWPKVVHGDQRLIVHRTLPAGGTVTARSRVVEVIDKGKDVGAVVRVETRISDAATGESLCTTTSGFFARGDGGFSSSRMNGPQFHTIPARLPDAMLDTRTQPNQALIYRLSGDRNPLHAVPSVALAAGFHAPVLHGLCQYGIACRAVLKTICDLEPSRIAEFDARFSSPMFPGETLRIEIWKDGAVVSFRGRCVERDRIVLDNGRALLRKQGE